MVKIISDSTSDLSQDLLDRYNITLVPLIVRLGDQQYEDRVNITSEEIFRWSDSTKKAPSEYIRASTLNMIAVSVKEAKVETTTAGINPNCLKITVQARIRMSP